ncbi:MAG: hypothetical protein R3258_09835, partial [Acidimicrobiia bacterium]|nr:hypothetical protein [Acidimicrobiia bacterium]
MSHDFVLDVIRRADPYPNEVPGPLPTDPESASKTLTEIDMRSRTMQTQESLRTGWLRKQTSFRPFRAAAIAAAVVVMAGLGIWLAAGQDSDGPVAAGSGPVEIAEEFLINL